VMGREFPQQIHIPRHQIILGDDFDWIPEFGQNGQASARQLQRRSMG